MANYMGKALSTGCNDNLICYLKTELMDLETMQWSNASDYPFSRKFKKTADADTEILILAADMSGSP